MIDIIVTTYNRLPFLKRTLESFFENTNLELVGKIIITDDGSTDGTLEYLKDFADGDKVIVIFGEREGIIPKFNKAYAMTTADIICEFQDDVTFKKGWLDELLKFIDKAEFVTGFDAPEHRAFQAEENYKIKHSSRFTQLIAKRSVWDKWFPMKPHYPFPTPCAKDGKHIGSKIDTSLSNGKINCPCSTTKFLVIPGLVEHVAEAYNSTWRKGGSKLRGVPTPKYKGGLTPDTIESYWNQRFAKQGAIAVGYAGKPKEVQDRILKEKYDFLSDKLDKNKRVLDYGCGAGKMAYLFSPDKYIGCDITNGFLAEAKLHAPEYEFYLLKDPMPVDMGFDFDVFFTSNVLQHNCDFLVEEIFKFLSYIKKSNFEICLYENTHGISSTNHMRFRRPEEYKAIIEKFFNLDLHRTWEVDSHIVHGQEHSFMRFKV